MNCAMKCRKSSTSLSAPRRAIDSTSSTMRSMRIVFFSMMSARRFWDVVPACSPSSAPAWRMAERGLRISWAMEADRRPIDASLSCWA